jgi:hypothetical protein
MVILKYYVSLNEQIKRISDNGMKGLAIQPFKPLNFDLFIE